MVKTIVVKGLAKSYLVFKELSFCSFSHTSFRGSDIVLIVEWLKTSGIVKWGLQQYVYAIYCHGEKFVFTRNVL